jgi:hypothetical protein
MLFLEQAIFTSLKTHQQEGYQLATTSPGITADVAKELAVWGPAHDSLVINNFGSTSINFHPLTSGDYCISRTIADGEEYSGRGGPRIYTHMLVASPDALAAFANNPIAIVEALTASGHLQVAADPTAPLTAIPLVGRASLISPLRLSELAGDPGLDALVLLLQLAGTSQRLAVRSHVPLERLFSGLLMLLPPRLRIEFSFSTGLRWSPRRPFRLIALPPDLGEQRNVQKSASATPLDLTRGLRAGENPPSGWAYLIRDLLQSRQFNIFPELLRRADEFATAERTLDQVAEEVESALQVELAL